MTDKETLILADKPKPLPCPFCGAESFGMDEGSTFRWRVPTCQECGATAGEVRIDTMSDKPMTVKEEECYWRGVAQWNLRA